MLFRHKKFKEFGKYTREVLKINFTSQKYFVDQLKQINNVFKSYLNTHS